jgi:ABC-type phosphate transport system substrate-binding protein
VRLLRTVLLILTVAAPCALLVAPSRAAGPAAFRVIVNPANGVSGVDRRFLADVFLKKVTRWGDGDLIRPADLRTESPTRQRFSEDILGRSVAAVKTYWQQLVFSGREVPPPEFDTDDEVVRYVLKHGGAVGYVSPGANIDRAKVVTVR